ncbi:chaperonin 10-like protein [Microdochium trichocladiopsis]|uniref:Chaperonin 10-like protein n=1 Tax=Microdochium trichocladiopsis TaxID=1682393 RepID=A0A9P8XVH2_9PEZI|nr:chaperonin 10-like protein [Microdochium trichocladiopsis]KAH7014547.1 chaperonin 10-like protein [Microdochium trichocladiopsis]
MAESLVQMGLMAASESEQTQPSAIMSSITTNGGSKTHLAAQCTDKGTPLSVSSRPTPTPGPGQVLIRPSAVALNIVDTIQRDIGFHVDTYPSVLGSDIGGTIVSAGPSGVPEYLSKPGTRVTTFASAFFEHGNPDYGAFQELVLVPAASVSPIPDGMDWPEAASLPMNIYVALAAWDMCGLDYLSPTAGGKNEAILVWGAATSIGTMAVQTAKLMGYTVVATASEANHEYLRGLGADVVFDYHDIEAAQKSVVGFVQGTQWMKMRYCFLGAGDLAGPQAILKELNGDQGGAFIAHAPLVPADAKTVDGVEVKFISPREGDDEREKQYAGWFNVYLREKLADGKIRPSPEVKIVGKGLAAIDAALTDLKEKGVKCAKPVILLQE